MVAPIGARKYPQGKLRDLVAATLSRRVERTIFPFSQKIFREVHLNSVNIFREKARKSSSATCPKTSTWYKGVSEKAFWPSTTATRAAY